MLKPYHHSIDEVAFVYAHAGLKEDDGNRIYEIAASILSRDTSRRDFSSLVRYRYLTERERYHSNISRESLKDAPAAEEVASRLKSFLEGQALILALDPHSVLDVLLRFCARGRGVDLSFTAEYFLPHVESVSPRGLWEYLFGKRREKISFSAAELVDLSIDLVRHLCGVRLNDEINPSSAALRYYLEASDTLLGEVLLHLTRHYQEYWGGLFSPVTRYGELDAVSGKGEACLSCIRDPGRSAENTGATDRISFSGVGKWKSGLQITGNPVGLCPACGGGFE